MGKPYYLETWLDYHFKIGIDKIYIFYDKKTSLICMVILIK